MSLPPSRPKSASVGRAPCRLLRDFATLIRPLSAAKTPDITNPAFFSGRAESVSALNHPMERSSRKLKSENRLYSFLTRSRSRSRSKNDPPDPPPKPKSRHTANDPSKPPSRIQSRPLSSTTITPSTPKASKRPPVVLNSPPAPATPKPSGTRQKLHDFFSIPLGRRSSRSRSRSRPNSPRPSVDVPPLPTTNLDDDPTPRPRKSFASHLPRTRSPSPSPEPKVLRVTNPTTTTTSSTGSTAASIKISKFFSSKASTPEPLPNSKHSASGSGPPVLPPIPSLVSNPLKRVSSLHRRSLKDPIDPLPTKNTAPKITHTPPTPLKNPTNASSSARMVYHTAKGSLDSSTKYRGAMGVVDEEGVTPARASSSVGHNSSSKGKARQGATSSHGHDDQPLLRPGLKSRMSSSARATKHGSFDFERPGWGATAMQRTGSNGTTNSAWSKNSELLSREREKERESTYGPGMAGVGTLQREQSMKRMQEREKMEKERARDKDRLKDRSREKERERPSTAERGTPASSNAPSDQMHGSTSTTGTGPANGKSSSMSRATGRRALLMKTSSGTGVTRLIGLTPAQHPPFSFEPAVPSPTRSTGTASTGTAHEVPLSSSWTSKAEKERERLREEKERLALKKVGSLRRGDRAPVPVPSVNSSPNYSAGHRSGHKGRSLDLGLGLAWAPSKVREEVLDLLPNSAYFTRTPSGGSSSHGHGHGHGHGHDRVMARTASGSTSRTRSVSGQSTSRSGWEEESREERSKLGKEVAEVFRNALEPRDYRLFKTYVHKFDADEIPFDGPKGIVSLVEQLLVNAPHLGDDGKRQLLDKFVRIILAQA